MKYEHPIKISQNEITKGLSSDALTEVERMNLVLSAVYYTSVPFAGDVLLDEFRIAQGSHKYNLMNVFGTFYQMLKTDYRVDDCISELNLYRMEEPCLQHKIDALIDEIEELMIIFGYR